MPGPTRFTIEDKSGGNMPSQATPEMNQKAQPEKAFFLPKKNLTACFTLDKYLELSGYKEDKEDK
ncbi:MAG: hypothetical protein J6Y02_10175 [Pseudobutyrivibrio sp.]|nr:hypothetical protein [Pseudobutyrivibrio sp.]